MAVLVLGQWQISGINAAKAAGKVVMMDEFNSASCGGKTGVSDTVSNAFPAYGS